jgi:hypothetical protein
VTDLEFTYGIERLKRHYGQDAFAPENEAIIAKAMKDLNANEWSEVIEAIIGDCRQTPMRKDFLKAADGFLQQVKKRREAAEDAEFASRRERGLVCRVCDDTGGVQAYKRKAPHSTTYSFGCPEKCLGYRKRGRSLIVWEELYRAKFLPCFESSSLSPIEFWQRNHEVLYGFKESDRESKKQVFTPVAGLEPVAEIISDVIPF